MSKADATPPMPRPVQQSPILKKKVWRRIHKKNQNFVGGVCGETGSGKSWSAIRIASALDPNFSVEQIAFGIEEFLHLVKDRSYGPGSFIVLEEAGVEASHREWYSKANQILNIILQTWREQNRGALLTLPELDKLDKTARSRLHAYLETVEKNEQEEWTRVKYQRIQTNPRSGKNYFKYPRLRVDGSVRKIKGFKVGAPDPDLIEKYEARKRRYNDGLIEGALDELTGEEDDGDAADIDPKEVATEIVDDDTIGDYMKDNHGQKYLDRDLLSLDYDLSNSESKKVKKLLLRECDDDVI